MVADSGTLKHASAHAQAASRDISEMKVRSGEHTYQALANLVPQMQEAQLRAQHLQRGRIQAGFEEIRRREAQERLGWLTQKLGYEQMEAQTRMLQMQADVTYAQSRAQIEQLRGQREEMGMLSDSLQRVYFSAEDKPYQMTPRGRGESGVNITYLDEENPYVKAARAKLAEPEAEVAERRARAAAEPMRARASRDSAEAERLREERLREEGYEERRMKAEADKRKDVIEQQRMKLEERRVKVLEKPKEASLGDLTEILKLENLSNPLDQTIDVDFDRATGEPKTDRGRQRVERLQKLKAEIDRRLGFAGASQVAKMRGIQRYVDTKMRSGRYKSEDEAFRDAARLYESDPAFRRTVDEYEQR